MSSAAPHCHGKILVTGPPLPSSLCSILFHHLFHAHCPPSLHVFSLSKHNKNNSVPLFNAPASVRSLCFPISLSHSWSEQCEKERKCRNPFSTKKKLFCPKNKWMQNGFLKQNIPKHLSNLWEKKLLVLMVKIGH